MLRLRNISALFAFVAAGFAAGCSGSNPHFYPGSATASPTLGPQTFNVVAGASTGNQAYQALAYYPSALTIDVGDTVTWAATSDEPHTISFPIPGTTPVPPTDPTAQQAAGGTTVDGSTYVSSGFIAGGTTYSLRFTKAGTYHYFSLPQLPVVSGTVVVQGAGSPYPVTVAGSTAAGAAAISVDLANAQQSVASVPFTIGSNTIAAGVSPATAGGATSTVMRYLAGPTEVDDLQTTIPVGTTLTVKNLSNNVPHTFTLPALGTAPPAGPPFQPAAGGNVYNGTALVNSGVIPPGGSFSVKFTAVGTYPYFCLFHAESEGMIGSIIVTP